MQIQKLTLYGMNMSSNCYILINGTEAIVIDPGFEDNNLYAFLSAKNLDVTKIILTHGHFDHWGGLKKLRILFPNAPLYASTLDNAWYELGSNNRYGYEPKIDFDLNKLNDLRIFDIKFKIYKVPGHSLGSIAIYNNKTLFSGDVLFFEGIGRYDLLDGNLNTLLASIKQLYTLPNETVVYSGHGNKTTIGHEKLNNPFIRG